MKQLCIVLALAVTGCSFVFTSGPSDESPRRSYPSCTQSMAWPVVDGVFSAIFLLSMSTSIASDEDEMPSEPVNQDDNATRAEKITSAAVLAAVTGVSAYVGYRRVSRCRRARESFQQSSPQPYGPYGYPQPTPYPQPYAPQPYPSQQPYPYPSAPRAAPDPQPAPPTPAPQPLPTALGTEGDVCAQTSECATGLLCTSNVCMRPPSKQ